MRTLQETIRDIAEDADDIQFRNTYSGRGMYAKKCIGIVASHSDAMNLIKEVLMNSDMDDLEDNICTLLDFKTDSMGRNQIFYWEDLEPLEEDTDE
jgi:hypothetical protein